MDGKNYTPYNEIEYEMLFNLRDIAILYDRLNPYNRYLKGIINILHNHINVLIEEIELDT